MKEHLEPLFHTSRIPKNYGIAMVWLHSVRCDASPLPINWHIASKRGFRTVQPTVPYQFSGLLDPESELAHPRGFEPLASAFGG
ncbi:MAG: hypothetical protein AAF941_02470, partial [Pseudomonadota bacterium]